MKRSWLTWLLIAVGSAAVVAAARAQSDERLAIIDEKLDHLRAAVDDVQFKQQKLQQQFDDLQAQIQNLRRADGTATAADLQALDARLKALDGQREKDKQVILDTLAKELANLSGGHAGPPAHPGPVPDGKLHMVQKGETLTVIAKAYGISVEDLKKANNLVDSTIRVGQKLTIPKRSGGGTTE